MKKLVILIIMASILIPNVSLAGGKNDILKEIEIIIAIDEYAQDIYKARNTEDKIRTTIKHARRMGVDIAAEATAVPVAVAGASYMGVTASTGTAISALSGAAATSATLAAIGGPASVCLGIVGISVAPAVVGGAIVAGAGAAVAWGINKLMDKLF